MSVPDTTAVRKDCWHWDVHRDKPIDIFLGSYSTVGRFEVFLRPGSDCSLQVKSKMFYSTHCSYIHCKYVRLLIVLQHSENVRLSSRKQDSPGDHATRSSDALELHAVRTSHFFSEVVLTYLHHTTGLATVHDGNLKIPIAMPSPASAVSW